MAGRSPTATPASTDREAERHRVERDLVDAGERRAFRRDDGAQESGANGKPCDSPGGREQNAFGEQLPDDATARGAERPPHRKLAVP